MNTFVGRREHLSALNRSLARIAESNTGTLLAVRGRRQVGKSRLITEFCERSGVPYLYFTGRRGADTPRQLSALTDAVVESKRKLIGADALGGVPTSWATAFRQLAVAVGQTPAVVVLDEFPWAAESDPALEAELQVAWDGVLERTPVLCILVGSDITVMERLTGHDRPLFGRCSELVVGPFNPSEVATATGAAPAAALDTFLITGGYPRLVAACGTTPVEDFVANQFQEDSSALLITGQRLLDAEFEPAMQARAVISAIGADQRSFSAITNQLGSKISSGPLTRSLKVLSDTKRVVAAELPAGPDPSAKLRRYRVADSYLRFWLRFVESHLDHIARGRSDLAITGFEAGWPSWRGRAVEPVVHEALHRLAPGHPVLRDAASVGAWWNRIGEEIDVVAADKQAQRVLAVGSIKWRTSKPFGAADLAAMATGRVLIPGAAQASLIAVTTIAPASDLSDHLEAVFLPEDLLYAWR